MTIPDRTGENLIEKDLEVYKLNLFFFLYLLSVERPPCLCIFLKSKNVEEKQQQTIQIVLPEHESEALET